MSQLYSHKIDNNSTVTLTDGDSAEALAALAGKHRTVRVVSAGGAVAVSQEDAATTSDFYIPENEPTVISLPAGVALNVIRIEAQSTVVYVTQLN